MSNNIDEAIRQLLMPGNKGKDETPDNLRPVTIVSGSELIVTSSVSDYASFESAVTLKRNCSPLICRGNRSHLPDDFDKNPGGE